MLARISFRQVPLTARVYARGYTSSLKEGSVASSKEFGYVVTAFFFLLLFTIVKIEKESYLPPSP